jgi:type III secretory pathway lipoprotein EscJ
MAKRLVLEAISHNQITNVLDLLRTAGIKAQAGAMIDSIAVILVEEGDVARAVRFLGNNRIEARSPDSVLTAKI